MGNRPNVAVLFLSALASLGGSFTPVNTRQNPNLKKYHSGGRKAFSFLARPIEEGYRFDSHGSMRRLEPKRDKSMSARQWKKHVKAERRAQAVLEKAA